MLTMGTVFGLLAVGMWQATGVIFYLYNFSIIGISLVLGMGLWPLLPKQHKHWARRLSQVLVGGYLFFGLGMGLIYIAFGVIHPENMQIEGLWFWLFFGVAQASVVHYLIAKIIGPLIFNRGWCGWACWTVAVLDLLPWRRPPGRAAGQWEYLRYVHFTLGLFLVAVLVHVYRYDLMTTLGIVKLKEVDARDITVYASMWQIPELWWFLGGNAFYYLSGIGLAIMLKDNRAFCKYLCPIVTFFKAGSRLSIIKIGARPERCNDCKACERSCPMDIRLTEYIKAGTRILSSECIICKTCTSVCPNDVLRLTFAADISTTDHLRRRISRNNGEDRASAGAPR